jgi:hypothetical protein
VLGLILSPLKPDLVEQVGKVSGVLSRDLLEGLFNVAHQLINP